MADGPTVELYYDPFDYAIDDDPYSVWKRMRAEAPLYFNDRDNFYALSRYDDVARALPDWQAYRSGRGTTADILFSGIEVPPGILLFEDPPLHDLHRRRLSRVFTPRHPAGGRRRRPVVGEWRGNPRPCAGFDAGRLRP